MEDTGRGVVFPDVGNPPRSPGRGGLSGGLQHSGLKVAIKNVVYIAGTAGCREGDECKRRLIGQ